MKRSNRLVLLIGIFLAIVAFVLIVLMLGNGGGGGGEPAARARQRRPTSSWRPRTSTSGRPSRQDQVGLKEIDIAAKPADSLHGHGARRRTDRAPGRDGRPAHHQRRSSTTRRHRSSSIDVPAGKVGHVGQGGPGQRRRHDRSSRATSWTPSWPSTSCPTVPRTRTTGPCPRPSASTPAPSRQGAAPGHAGPGHAAAGAAGRPQASPRRAARPPPPTALHHPQRPGADRHPRGDAPAGRGPQVRADRRRRSRWCCAAARTCTLRCPRTPQDYVDRRRRARHPARDASSTTGVILPPPGRSRSSASCRRPGHAGPDPRRALAEPPRADPP